MLALMSDALISWLSFDHVLTAVEGVATLAFALSGLVAAVRKGMDAVGVCMVAGLTAFGGGTLRDVLLDRRPFFWVEHWEWLWVLLALTVLALAFLRRRHLSPTLRAIQWPDAIGLGLFAASGAQIALSQGLPGIVCALMGMITAVFGGVLRDIVCNEIPSAFSDHQPYAVCAFAGGWVLVGAHALNAPGWLALVIAASTASGLRAGAMVTGVTLPQWGAKRP